MLDLDIADKCCSFETLVSVVLTDIDELFAGGDVIPNVPFRLRRALNRDGF